MMYTSLHFMYMTVHQLYPNEINWIEDDPSPNPAASRPIVVFGGNWVGGKYGQAPKGASEGSAEEREPPK